MNQRFFSLAAHLRARFSRRVQKIPLDVGADCPNRDGTAGTGGCAFCSPRGAGSGLSHLPLAAQWERWAARTRRKYGAHVGFMAYLQDHTATHLPLARLAALLAEAASLPDCLALAVSTRPDTLDDAKLSAIAAVPLGEIWLDMGLQSAHDATLSRIGRGHDAASFATACDRAAACGLLVCGHVILGLPGETQEHWLSTIDFLNRLPVAGVKFHNLFVSRGSALESAWQAGRFIPPEMDAYVQGLARCLERLRPDVVIHRLHADPAPGELAAPAWAADRTALRRAIENTLTRLDVRQGMGYHAKTGPYRAMPGHPPEKALRPDHGRKP